METYRRCTLPLFLLLVLVVGSLPAWAAVSVQCPEDQDGDGVPAVDIHGTITDPDDADIENVKCMHLSAGDGFVTMADGRSQYMFGFADVTGIPAVQVMQVGSLAHEFSAPPIVLDQGDEFYLTLTNVGMAKRADLFDPHTVHYHGFPQSSNIYDGLPESGISINMGASLTYYYLNNDPGTYMYHCHVEATEHMQMGMLGVSTSSRLRTERNTPTMEDPSPSLHTTTAMAPRVTIRSMRSSSAVSTRFSTMPVEPPSRCPSP